MIQIRKGVFETNSSSTHSFTLKKELGNRDTIFKEIKTDKENNLIIEFEEVCSIYSTYYEGFHSKLSYILLLLINGLDIVYDYDNEEDTNNFLNMSIEEMLNLEVFQPLVDTIKEIGYKGIKIKRNLDYLNENEKKLQFTLGEIFNNLWHHLDSDNFIKNTKMLEDKFELSLKEILTNDEIILVEIDRDDEDRIGYTYHSKYNYKKMKEKENDTN